MNKSYLLLILGLPLLLSVKAQAGLGDHRSVSVMVDGTPLEAKKTEAKKTELKAQSQAGSQPSSSAQSWDVDEYEYKGATIRQHYLKSNGSVFSVSCIGKNCNNSYCQNFLGSYCGEHTNAVVKQNKRLLRIRRRSDVVESENIIVNRTFWGGRVKINAYLKNSMPPDFGSNQ